MRGLPSEAAEHEVPAGAENPSPDSVPRPRWAVALGAVLLGLFVLQASWAARSDSVTIDEFAHLPTGLYYLRTGDFSVDSINPPLARMIAALPLLWHRPKFDSAATQNHWAMGYQLSTGNAEDYQRMLVDARFMITVLGAVLGALVMHWAARLYGWQAGLVAGFLFCFSPSMLAHSHLVTLDLAGALGFTASAYAAWRLLARPRVLEAVLLGAAIGLSTLLKLSAFVLLAAVVVVIGVRALREPRPRWSQWLGLLVVVGASALLTLNLGYGFQGTFASLDKARLAEGGLLFSLREAAPWLRLPLPAPFVDGVDMILNVGKVREPSYFLAGELSAEGWWYYHLAAFALKTPLVLVGASLYAFVSWLVGRSPGLRDYCLFVPILILFAANSAFNSLYIGVRHVLPVYPLLFIVVSPWLAGPLFSLLGLAGAGAKRRDKPGRSRSASRGGKGLPANFAGAAAAAALLWFAVGSAAVAPRYLQYFSEAAGGAGGGHRWLIDSNIDWGQDLIRLSDYMAANQIEWINLAYFGRVDPRVYGVRFAPLDQARLQGYAAVSATFLMGRPYFWIKDGRMRWMPAETFAWVRDLEPIDRVGSMFIYKF